MRYRRFRIPSKPTIFAILMAGSVLVAILPETFFRQANDMTQLLGLLQYPITKATRGIADSMSTLVAEDISPDQHAKLVQAARALENENVALRQEAVQLKTTIDGLTSIRNTPGFGV